jgi:hypothetical protein
MGMVGAMVLSMILPNGSLQSSVEPNQLFAPFVMLGVSIPMFLSPVAAMVQVAGMFEHGNSVGAAFTLLIVGAGINLGTIAWIWQSYGVRRGLNFLLALLGVVMLLAYAVDRPLYPTGVQAVGHTHAFDQFCFPVPGESELTGAMVLFQLRGIAEELHVVFGLGLLVICLSVGLILTRMDRQGLLQKWFERESNQQWRVDRNLSRMTLSLVSLLGLVVLSIVGCFVYYPPIPDVFAELSSVNTRLAASSISKNWQEAAHWVPAAENWTRKLTTSKFLRGETSSDYQNAKASVYLENLERLEHAIESENPEVARKFALQGQNDLRRLKKAWLEPEP